MNHIWLNFFFNLTQFLNCRNVTLKVGQTFDSNIFHFNQMYSLIQKIFVILRCLRSDGICEINIKFIHHIVAELRHVGKYASSKGLTDH